MSPPPPLDTLETRLVRIEGMLDEITDRLIGGNNVMRETRDSIDALKDNLEERLWTLLKLLQDGKL